MEINYEKELGARYSDCEILDIYQAYAVNRKRRMAKVKCHCGAIFETRLDHLRGLRARSCGCIQKAYTSLMGKAKKLPDGVSRMSQVEYRLFWSMISRCTNIKYKNYAGRGITVCQRWKDKENGYINFLEDMGRRPSDKHTLDRINNDANYSCGKCEECLENGWPMNCRWATMKEQCNNKRNNRTVSYNGKTLTATEWARFYQQPEYLFWRMIKKNLSDIEIIQEFERNFNNSNS